MKTNIFFAFLISTKKDFESGVGFGSGARSGSISQRYGSGDPDPHQNVTDPQHFGHCITIFVTKSVTNMKLSSGAPRREEQKAAPVGHAALLGGRVTQLCYQARPLRGGGQGQDTKKHRWEPPVGLPGGNRVEKSEAEQCVDQHAREVATKGEETELWANFFLVCRFCDRLPCCLHVCHCNNWQDQGLGLEICDFYDYSGQGCGSAFTSSGSGSRALMTKNLKNITDEKKIQFVLDQKLQFSYPYAFIKNVQVTEEAFSSQTRTSNTSKHGIFFLLFMGHFCPPGSGSGSTDPIESGSFWYPDPQPWFWLHSSAKDA